MNQKTIKLTSVAGILSAVILLINCTLESGILGVIP